MEVECSSVLKEEPTRRSRGTAAGQHHGSGVRGGGGGRRRSSSNNVHNHNHHHQQQPQQHHHQQQHHKGNTTTECSTTTTAAATTTTSHNIVTVPPPPPAPAAAAAVAAAAAAANLGAGVTVKVGLNMNMCRLCLAEGTSSSRLQPVYYAKDAPDEILLQKIIELTTVHITYATDFPSSICSICRARLDEYYHFRRQCIENDEILRMKYYELKAAEDYHNRNQQAQHHQLQQQHELEVGMVEAKHDEYIADDGDDITLAIDESSNGVEAGEGIVEEEYLDQDQDDHQHQSLHHQQQQTIQYVSSLEENDEATGIVATTEVEESEDAYVEEVTATNDIRSQQQIHLSGYGEGETSVGETGEGHEIYYTDGTDTYTIHTTAEGYVNAANYVPQGYDNQTEIECTTTIDPQQQQQQQHEPEPEEEEVYMEEPGPCGRPGTSVIAAPPARGVHDRPFVCKHCKTSFKYEYNYERHMKNHAKVLFRCGKCSKTFTKQRKCQQHFLKAHSSQRYECDICFRTYSLPTRLENHIIEMHSENGVYRCDRCADTFTSYLDFKSHRNTHHQLQAQQHHNVNGTSIGQMVAVQTIDHVSLQQQQQSRRIRATSLSRSSLSDGCDFEVMIDETKIPKPSPSASSSTSQPLEESLGPAEAKRPLIVHASTPAPILPEQEVILIDDETTATKTIIGRNATAAAIPHINGTGSPSATTILMASPTSHVLPLSASNISNGNSISSSSNSNSNIVGASTSVITNGTNGTGSVEKNSLHRQLLQQIEESEASSIGPKIYNCDSCPKTFVHLNNLKAHIYAEHDNDKPFKCKLCPISFKTKEILVMHMVLHSQHNAAT